MALRDRRHRLSLSFHHAFHCPSTMPFAVLAPCLSLSLHQAFRCPCTPFHCISPASHCPASARPASPHRQPLRDRLRAAQRSAADTPPDSPTVSHLAPTAACATLLVPCLVLQSVSVQGGHLGPSRSQTPPFTVLPPCLSLPFHHAFRCPCTMPFAVLAPSLSLSLHTISLHFTRLSLSCIRPPCIAASPTFTRSIARRAEECDGRSRVRSAPAVWKALVL